MKFKILGSGGAMPVPRPFCQCELCSLARKNKKYRRNSCSAFIEEIRTLIDCPEDIGNSLNTENIKQIDNMFITHWHPLSLVPYLVLILIHFSSSNLSNTFLTEYSTDSLDVCKTTSGLSGSSYGSDTPVKSLIIPLRAKA